MNRQEGRIHYGRQTTRSNRETTTNTPPTGLRQSTPAWYNTESAETARARRYRSSESVWAESSDARTRRAERQGTARDARRTLERHESQSHRTQSRRTVYNTGGSQEEADMFQAVASEDRMHNGLDGVNARGSWRSSNSSDYPALRDHHRSNFIRAALPILILILLVVAIVLGVRGCMGA